MQEFCSRGMLVSSLLTITNTWDNLPWEQGKVFCCCLFVCFQLTILERSAHDQLIPLLMSLWSRVYYRRSTRQSRNTLWLRRPREKEQGFPLSLSRIHPQRLEKLSLGTERLHHLPVVPCWGKVFTTWSFEGICNSNYSTRYSWEKWRHVHCCANVSWGDAE